MMRKKIALWITFLLVSMAIADSETSQRDSEPRTADWQHGITVWYGQHQEVGHLGPAQDDFNLMGCLWPPEQFQALSYTLNRAEPITLKIARGLTGFRRLARAGHFNADIPIRDLRPGKNHIVLTAVRTDSTHLSEDIYVHHHEQGTCPLPYTIHWQDVNHPQDVGQCVDGFWQLGPKGLRTGHTGYDRIFLIGNRSWQDYEVTVPVTIHYVPQKTGPRHGGNGVGLILRFTGHIAGGHRKFPPDQPKWGYQPFGAIGWLRWEKGLNRSAPKLEFYRGDNDQTIRHGLYRVRLEQTYQMKMRCHTLPDTPEGHGVTEYSFKIWPHGKDEPQRWHWQATQTSEHALRRGGIGLLAHHVDATFGDVTAEPIDPER